MHRLELPDNIVWPILQLSSRAIFPKHQLPSIEQEETPYWALVAWILISVNFLFLSLIISMKVLWIGMNKMRGPMIANYLRVIKITALSRKPFQSNRNHAFFRYQLDRLKTNPAESCWSATNLGREQSPAPILIGEFRGCLTQALW